MSSRAEALAGRGLNKQYVGGDGTAIHVLRGVDLEVARGEAVSVIGQSGSGKSTLLHVLGGLDRPNSGEVWIGGQKLDTHPIPRAGIWGRIRLRGSRAVPMVAGEDRVARLRNEKVGFVFQFHHLMREFTAVENVMMPQLIAGEGRRAAEGRARELLAAVGMEHRLTHKPGQLSGGEQQRVAVARALANRPLVLLADEPSGNLDPQTSERLHDLLFQVCAEEEAAMVLVTHDMGLASRAGRVLRMTDGHLAPVDAVAAEEVG